MSEHNYGVFYNNWTPKTGATAIHNLTTILKSGRQWDGLGHVALQCQRITRGRPQFPSRQQYSI